MFNWHHCTIVFVFDLYPLASIAVCVWINGTHMGEYQIVVHFDVPHLIHVIGYCAHYRYGVFSREEGVIKFILTHYGLFFS